MAMNPSSSSSSSSPSPSSPSSPPNSHPSSPLHVDESLSEEEASLDPLESDLEGEDEVGDDGNDAVQVQRDEEAFVNFVKGFKYDSKNSQDQKRSNHNSDIFMREKRKYRDEFNGEGEVKSWDQYFEKLKEFQLLQGHCYVPYDWNEDIQFAQWVSRQRVRKNKGKLSSERVEKLESIGFIWSAVEGGAFKMRWEQKFEELKKYKEDHGDCNVPYRWPDNPQLANWVFRQREHRKAGKLTPDRETKLEELSFMWGLNNAVSKDNRWDMRYADLVEYKHQFGHCCVPNVFKKNQQLANWVRKQRELRKKDKLPLERVDKLDELGFVWEVGAGKPKEETFKKRKKGTVNAPTLKI